MVGDHITVVSSFDRLFDQSLTSEYHLSIRLEPDGLSFSVYVPKAGKFVGLESFRFTDNAPTSIEALATKRYCDQLDLLLFKHPWLTAGFKSCCVIVQSNKYTMVPAALYQPELKRDYLGFVHSVSDSNAVFEQKVVSIDSWLVYAVDEQINNVIARHFPTAKKLQHTGSIIDSILPSFRHADLSDTVFVNVKTGSFDIIVLKDGKLRYCNSFLWKVADDLVYFLIFVMDQLALNPEKIPIYLMGNIQFEDNLYQLMFRYIRSLNFVKMLDGIRGNFAVSEEMAYKYYDLLNPGLCV
ncbi:MAG: DUF3822 family protein [Lentimicrobiaceae bacterium]|nr:DUF3822 family protein [Lentimicrobiaceae bacterium]MCB9023891.1 DUF3822 family protein [Lentimicrobiaceae bacterium]MCO5266200.1 DUF3822 family protein [Lentimicrobium sp.]